MLEISIIEKNEVKCYTYDVADRMNNAMFTKAGIVTLNQVNTYNGNGQSTKYYYQNGAVLYTTGKADTSTELEELDDTEILTGEVLNIPCDLLEFLNVEIPVYNDAGIASTFYKEWVEYSGEKAKTSYCIGYKVPLYLGGEDDISNLEKIDMEVYWSITGQLRNQSF